MWGQLGRGLAGHAEDGGRLSDDAGDEGCVHPWGWE